MNIDGASPLVLFRDPSILTLNDDHPESIRRFDSEASDYFRMRERCERAAAKLADSHEARGVHQELAEMYAELLHKAAGVTDDV